jgi:hypothetical protein
MLHILLSFCAWTLTLIFIWDTYKLAKRSFASLKRMHQIPCSSCVFYTGDYRLKCPVHPCIALSEEALNCKDYQSSRFP